MAIFNMEDSSLNEYYLNEHGGAHRRYAKMIVDKDKKLKKREEAFRTIGTDAADIKADRIRRRREDLKDDNLKYIDTSGDDISKAYKKRKFAEKNPDSIQNMVNRNNYIQAKKNFKRDFSGESKNTINTNDRKPGAYLAAQKKLKEAAEYILSVLDEAEKNDRKMIDNKDLNNTFKNVVKSKVKELYDKGKVVDIDSLPDSDIKNKIKK